jgi:hypothetical protein
MVGVASCNECQNANLNLSAGWVALLPRQLFQVNTDFWIACHTISTITGLVAQVASTRGHRFLGFFATKANEVGIVLVCPHTDMDVSAVSMNERIPSHESVKFSFSQGPSHLENRDAFCLISCPFGLRPILNARYCVDRSQRTCSDRFWLTS